MPWRAWVNKSHKKNNWRRGEEEGGFPVHTKKKTVLGAVPRRKKNETGEVVTMLNREEKRGGKMKYPQSST